MDTKFTPGPWEAVTFTVPGHEFWVATIKGGDLKPTEKGDEGRANARLIAAAPDMYEALKWAKKLIEAIVIQRDIITDPEEIIAGPIMKTIDAALAKVRP